MSQGFKSKLCMEMSNANAVPGTSHTIVNYM